MLETILSQFYTSFQCSNAWHVTLSRQVDNCVSEDHDDEIIKVFIGEEKEYEKILGFLLFQFFLLLLWPHFEIEIIICQIGLILARPFKGLYYIINEFLMLKKFQNVNSPGGYSVKEM